MRRLPDTLVVLPFLVKLFIKTELEYRGAWLLDRVAQVVNYGAGYAAIWILLDRFGTLGGWTWPELALLLSFQLLVYSFGAAFSFVQMRELEDYIHRGQFDVLMVKPFSPWAYLVFSRLNVDYAGHIALAIPLMVWSLTEVHVAWSAGLVLYVVAAIISATMVVAALMTIIGACAFVLVRSRYLYSIFFGLFELTRYPLTIFPAGIQWVLFTIVPLGFISFVPVAFLLGRPVPLLGAAGGALALVAGPVCVLLAMAHWTWSVRRYQSGGG